jgi:quinol-cytochrome oxidoreductase complex cytochrome b subunit
LRGTNSISSRIINHDIDSHFIVVVVVVVVAEVHLGGAARHEAVPAREPRGRRIRTYDGANIIVNLFSYFVLVFLFLFCFLVLCEDFV